MSREKQSKYIDDKISEAANAAEYEFNEASWKKMELLLDKQKSKRRPFLWIFGSLLFVMLLLGGGIIYWSVDKGGQLKNKSDQISGKDLFTPDRSSLNKIDAVTALTLTTPQSSLTDTTVSANHNSVADSKVTPASGNQFRNQHNTAQNSPDLVKSFSPVINLISTKNRVEKNNKPNDAAEAYRGPNKNIYTDRNKFAVKISVPEAESDLANENKMQAGIVNNSADPKKNQTELQKIDLVRPEVTRNSDTAATKTNPHTKSVSKPGKKINMMSGLYLVGHGGAEASSAKLTSYKNSTITAAYGGGVGYRLNKRLSLQTGFYAAAKKYIAGPDDYKPRAGSYLSTVTIIKVDANCMVYEVPVTVQYNWLIKTKTNYYASVGLSSYIMKKEKYIYTFERNYTQYSYPYQYTKNSHLLASLQLSVGIEKKLTPKLFMQAAPLIALPLQGVGEGSIKIFTTRLQVGLKYFPLRR